MSTVVLDRSIWVSSSDDYIVKEEPKTWGESFTLFYSKSLLKHLAYLKAVSYSPDLYTPKSAGKLVKGTNKELKAFFKLEKMFRTVRDVDESSMQIHTCLVEIVLELRESILRLEKLSDPKTHKAISKTVNNLELSTFFRED
jgi:hypothetical protein